MVIENEVKDFGSFVTRLAMAEELLSPDSLMEPKLYIPCGFITRNQAEAAAKANKKYDDLQRRKHKLVEKFFELSTHISKDVLFETMIDLMDILGKNSLYMGDFDFIHENAEDVYEKYLELQNAKKSEGLNTKFRHVPHSQSCRAGIKSEDEAEK